MKLSLIFPNCQMSPIEVTSAQDSREDELITRRASVPEPHAVNSNECSPSSLVGARSCVLL